MSVLIAAALFAVWRFGLFERSQMTFLDEDGFPLNVNPEIVSAQHAPLEDTDLVMGVFLGEEARAYPVNYMNGPHPGGRLQLAAFRREKR